MVEVPEYLLERSRARRAALGGAPSGAGPTPAGSDTEGGAPEAAAPAAASAPAVPAAATPAGPAPAGSPMAVQAPAVPVSLAPPPSKTGIPRWMMPVLVVLPFWAILYMGAFGTQSKAAVTPAQLGSQAYTKNCTPCHGARGEGGVGPKLAAGEAKLTFPNEADHVAWVENGSSPKKGQPYGDPARAGGQHVAKTGGMPAFKGTLNDAQIKAVVTYERESLK